MDYRQSSTRSAERVDRSGRITAALPLSLSARLLQGPPSQQVCRSGDRNLPSGFSLSLAHCIDRLWQSLAGDEGPSAAIDNVARLRLIPSFDDCAASSRMLAVLGRYPDSG